MKQTRRSRGTKSEPSKHRRSAWAVVIALTALLGSTACVELPPPPSSTCVECDEDASPDAPEDAEDGRDTSENDTSADAAPDLPDAENSDASDDDTSIDAAEDGECTPLSCAENACGRVSDGCEGELDCGICVGESVCGSANLCQACDNGMHNGGDGLTCVAEDTCLNGFHDGGDGSCVPAGACISGFILRSDGRCAGWVERRAMPHPRRNHQAVYIPSLRQIMVIGGVDERGNTLATTEFYVPTEDRWYSGPALETPRQGHKAVLSSSSELLVVGGTSAATAGERWSPTVPTFARVNGQFPPGSQAAAISDTDAYVASDGSAPWLVKIATGQVSRPEPLSSGAYFFMVLASLEGGGALAFGNDGFGPIQPQAHRINDDNDYAWQSVSGFRDPHKGVRPVTFGGRVVFVGGTDSVGCEAYDPQLREVSTCADVPRFISNYEGFAHSEGLFICGGRAEGTVTNRCMRLPSPSGTWEPDGPMREARENFQVVTLPDGDVVAIGGRLENGEPTASVEMYVIGR